MRLHVVGLPHTDLSDEFSWCAYSMKARRFVWMMESLGHELFVYWGRGADGYIPPFDGNDPAWREMNSGAIAAITKNAQDGDYLCLAAGDAQVAVAAAFPNLVAVEYGVGYGGVFTNFRVFESYAWQHAVYAAKARNAHEADGRFYDAVIPNSYHEEEFPAGDGKGGYLLYMSRIIPRKGIQIAIETAKRVGIPLKVAGLGDKALLTGYDRIEYLGVVGPKERAELMGGALATLAPTIYLEPFGGVAIESLMCGTPVISTDWGGFVENIVNGRDGYRCRMLSDFVDAVALIAALDRDEIRRHAIARFSTEVVRYSYDAYFRQLETLKGEGWYATNWRGAEARMVTTGGN